MDGYSHPGIPEILTQDQHLGDIHSSHPLLSVPCLLAYSGEGGPLAVVLEQLLLLLLSLSVGDNDQLGRSDFIAT